MGDAGSAILIEKASNNPSYFQLYSDGSGEKALYIPNWVVLMILMKMGNYYNRKC